MPYPDKLPTEETQKPKPNKEDLQTVAINALLAFGVPVKDAQKYVNITLAKMPGCLESTAIAKEAYHLYMESVEKKPVQDPAGNGQGNVLDGYDANKKNGNVGI